MKVTPKDKKVNFRKTATLTVRVSNASGSPVLGCRCQEFERRGSDESVLLQNQCLIGAGQTRKVFKIKKTAKGKSAKVKFTITSPDAKKVKASVKVRRK